MVRTRHPPAWMGFHRRIHRSASLCALSLEQVSPSRALLLLWPGVNCVLFSLDNISGGRFHLSAPLQVARRERARPSASVGVCLGHCSDSFLLAFWLETDDIHPAGAAGGGFADRRSDHAVSRRAARRYGDSVNRLVPA